MKIKFTLFLTFLLFISSCGESEYENNIPYSRIGFMVYHVTDFGGQLTSPGACVIVPCNHNGGDACQFDNHGTIVCRMLQSDAYLAFAATCPIDLGRLQIVNDAILKVKCSKCGRVYELDNNGLSGNARLVRYMIRMSITNLNFEVYN